MENASKARQVHSKYGQGERPYDGYAKQKKKRTARPIGYDFLGACFPPIIERGKDGFRNWRVMDSDFQRSMENFCSLYGFTVPQEIGKCFPMNISNAFQQLKHNLEIVEKGLELVIMGGRGGRATLATIKTFDTKHTLYYLPIMPLYELSKDIERSDSFELLRAVLALLYHAGVAHFSEDYLGGTYEIMKDWYEQDDDVNDQHEQHATLAHLEDVTGYGLLTVAMLKKRPNLAVLRKRISDFVPHSPFEEELAKIAGNALSLFFAYPKRKLQGNLRAKSFDDDLHDEYPISIGQYISFCWDYYDCIFDMLWDTVNNDLQENCQTEEPFAVQFFDTPQARENHDLNFEQGFFDLLHAVTDVLKDFSHERHYQSIRKDLSA